MTKISYKNAKERIGEMTKGFRKNERGNFVVTEEQYDALVARIMEESTKTFANALAYYTRRAKSSGCCYDARIATYAYHFGCFDFE